MAAAVSIDLSDFRAAAEVAKEFGGHSGGLDLSPLHKVAGTLEGLTRDVDEFLDVDVATRCLLRGGAARLGKKFTDDRKLFHLLREMLGNTRKFAELDEPRRARTGKFLEGVANL